MMSQSDLSKMQYDESVPTIATRQLPRSGFVQYKLCRRRHEFISISNLLAHAPERLHAENPEDNNEKIYGKTPEESEKPRKAYIRKCRLKHEAVANSLEEAGDRLFTLRACRQASGVAHTTNAIERLREFKRRIKTQTVLPSASCSCMLFVMAMQRGSLVAALRPGGSSNGTRSPSRKSPYARRNNSGLTWRGHAGAGCASRVCLIRPGWSSSTRPPLRPIWRGCAGAAHAACD